jgi:hypothetical protein
MRLAGAVVARQRRVLMGLAVHLQRRRRSAPGGQVPGDRVQGGGPPAAAPWPSCGQAAAVLPLLVPETCSPGTHLEYPPTAGLALEAVHRALVHQLQRLGPVAAQQQGEPGERPGGSVAEGPGQARACARGRQGSEQGALTASAVRICGGGHAHAAACPPAAHFASSSSKTAQRAWRKARSAGLRQRTTLGCGRGAVAGGPHCCRPRTLAALPHLSLHVCEALICNPVGTDGGRSR